MAVSFHGLEFERLGHASVRIETGDGRVIYIDPWTNVYDEAPHDGDVVFVTHDDFDHYDPEAIENVAGPDATVAVYEAVDTSDLDRAVVDLPYEGETEVAGIPVRTTCAHNKAEGDHVDEDGNPFHDTREVIGLVLDLDGVSVYFPSDTDFLSALESVTADVFIPPIGGHYTIDRHEAAAFARSVDPELVLPVHYDTFDAIETDAEAFAAELESDGIRVELF
jgi:L-ascorbate metabolism protein UlaG (beta-lactamase superfamily)